MMRIIMSFVLVFLGFCLQMTLLPSFSVRGDLVFVLVAYFSLVYGWKVGLFLAIFGGMLIDSFSLSSTSIITLGLTAFFSGILRDAVFTESIITKFISFVFINIFYFFINYLSMKFSEYAVVGFVSMYFMPYVIYNFVLAVIVFLGLEKFYGKV